MIKNSQELECSANRKPNVLAISYLFPNSVMPNYGIFVLNRLLALTRYANIKVINPIPYFPGQQLFNRYKHYALVPPKETIAGLEVYHPRFFSIPKFLKGLEARTYSRSVFQIIQALDLEFDLIDLHWTYPDLPVGQVLKARYQKPLLCTLRGMEAFYQKQGNARERLIADGLKQCDALIALSEELKYTADQLTGEPEKSAVVINGSDTQNFSYIAIEEARSSLGLDAFMDANVILAVGSLIRRKGFHRIIESLPEILRDKPDTHLFIVGSEGPEGDYRQQLFSLVSSMGLSSHVHFVGAVANTQLRFWYNAANVFCLASTGEGSPNVLSEALACGCPAVSSTVGSAEDIMKNADLVHFLWDTEKPTELAGLLLRALQEPPDRAELSNRCKAFDWAWCASNVVPIYRRCLQTHQQANSQRQ